MHALEELETYYQRNALRPNPSKTKSCAFHLRNNQAARPLVINWRNTTIEHSSFATYLGVTLDRSLNFKQHCLNTKAKVCARNNILRRLTTTSWGAAPEVMRTSGLSLCFSAGEYACPVWHRSTHAREVDIALNDTCRAITGCLKPTPLCMLYPLAGIAPPAVRREIACSVEKRKQESDPRHPLHDFKNAPIRLKSRKSFMRSTSACSSVPSNARLNLWTINQPPPPYFIAPAEELPPGRELPWPVWKCTNRLRTQVGRCRCNLAKWGMISASETHCSCGAPSQTMSHLLECPACPNSCTLEDLMTCQPNAIEVASHWSPTI